MQTSIEWERMLVQSITYAATFAANEVGLASRGGEAAGRSSGAQPPSRSQDAMAPSAPTRTPSAGSTSSSASGRRRASSIAQATRIRSGLGPGSSSLGRAVVGCLSAMAKAAADHARSSQSQVPLGGTNGDGHAWACRAFAGALRRCVTAGGPVAMVLLASCDACNAAQVCSAALGSLLEDGSVSSGVICAAIEIFSLLLALREACLAVTSKASRAASKVQERSMQIRARTRSATGDASIVHDALEAPSPVGSELALPSPGSAAGSGEGGAVGDRGKRRFSSVARLQVSSRWRWSMDAAVPGAGVLRRAVAHEGQRRQSTTISTAAMLSERQAKLAGGSTIAADENWSVAE